MECDLNFVYFLLNPFRRVSFFYRAAIRHSVRERALQHYQAFNIIYFSIRRSLAENSLLHSFSHGFFFRSLRGIRVFISEQNVHPTLNDLDYAQMREDKLFLSFIFHFFI